MSFILRALFKVFLGVTYDRKDHIFYLSKRYLKLIGTFYFLLLFLTLFIYYKESVSTYKQIEDILGFYLKDLNNDKTQLMKNLEKLTAHSFQDLTWRADTENHAIELLSSFKIFQDKLRGYFSNIPSGYPLVKSAHIGSYFGFREDPLSHSQGFHTGIDLLSFQKTPIIATGNGIIINNAYSKTYGYTITILHFYGYKSVYAHMNGLSKQKIGNIVKQGEVIGFVGNSGRSSGSHLHYEIIHENYYQNPLEYIDLVNYLFENK
jgi:murein DD-endopeptidase MepM/ murein hydrolase activator NlpD